MTDPVPLKLRPRPRRAAPLQPDRPWRDASADGAPAAAPVPQSTKGTPDDPEAVERQKKQAEAALQNVREGYD